MKGELTLGEQKNSIYIGFEGFEKKLISFYQEQQKALYFTAFTILGNKEDSEDIVQETCIRALKNVSKIRNTDSLKSWIYKILINTCKSYKIKKSKEKTNDFDFNNIIGGSIPEEEICFWDTVKGLDKDSKELILLRYVSGFKYEEISNILSIPIGTVKSKINRLNQKLYKELRSDENG